MSVVTHSSTRSRAAEVLILGQLDPTVLGRMERKHRLVSIVSRSEFQLGDATSVAREVRVIVVRSPFAVSGALMRRLPRLQTIVRAGSGTDNIDLASAAERGIEVVTTPRSSASVAELAFGLLLAVARRIPRMHQDLAGGVWRKAEGIGTELDGKRLLVVGFGRIGRRVARIGAGFGMSISVVDRSLDKAEKLEALRRSGGVASSLRKAVEVADVIVLACPLTEDTRNLIDKRMLKLMRPTAILVNVARDALVDQQAVLQALDSGRLGGLGIDGFSTADSAHPPLLRHPRVVATPHVGAQTVEAHDRIGQEVEYLVAARLARGTP